MREEQGEREREREREGVREREREWEGVRARERWKLTTNTTITNVLYLKPSGDR